MGALTSGNVGRGGIGRRVCAFQDEGEGGRLAVCQFPVCQFPVWLGETVGGVGGKKNNRDVEVC